MSTTPSTLKPRLCWRAARTLPSGEKLSEIRYNADKGIFDELVVEENVDVTMVKGFVNNPALGVVYKGNTKYDKKKGFSFADMYDNENKMMRAYLGNYDPETKSFLIRFKRPKHGYGREFAIGSLSLNAMPKTTRHTLCQPDETLPPIKRDCDAVNCHPTLASSYCDFNGLDCPDLKAYALDPSGLRQAVVDRYSKDNDGNPIVRKPAPSLKPEESLTENEKQLLIETYGAVSLRPINPETRPVDLDMAKDMFFVAMFGGGHKRWFNDNDPYDDFKDIPLPDNVIRFFEDATKVRVHIFEHNKQIVNAMVEDNPGRFKTKLVKKATTTSPAIFLPR